MDLFKKKDELINQIFNITKEVSDFLSDDSFKEYKKVVVAYKKRQSIMEDIDRLDAQIKEQGLSIEDYPELKSSMSVTLESIGVLDSKIAEAVQAFSEEVEEEIRSIKDGRKGLDMTRGKEFIAGYNIDVSK